jgi:hypothetical protein
VRPAILEREPGAGHELAGRRRHDQLARLGLSHYPRGDGHGDAAYLLADLLDLADVDAGANLNAQLANRLDDLERSGDRLGRRVEDDEEAVARGVQLTATVALERAPHGRVMQVDQLAPRLVAQLRRVLGRTDDVRHQDGRQESLRAPSSRRHAV